MADCRFKAYANIEFRYPDPAALFSRVTYYFDKAFGLGQPGLGAIGDYHVDMSSTELSCLLNDSFDAVLDECGQQN